MRVFLITMYLRRETRGCTVRRNVEEPKLTNAPEVQPQGEVTNEFREAIQMFSQMVTNHVGQQRRARLKEDNTSRTHEFLRMNPPNFTG